MRISVRTSLIILLLLFASGLGLRFVGLGDIVQSGITTVRVVPPEVANPDLSPSQDFTITVELVNVTDLKGFDIRLSWNASILSYTSHTVKVPVETYPDGVLYQSVMEVKNEVNATLGTYWAAFATIDGPSFNGTGTVFEMTYTVLDFGECLLDIYYSALANSAAEPIGHVVEDGYFSNAFYDVAVLSVTPSSQSAFIGDVLNVTVVVLNNGTTRDEAFEVIVYYNSTLIASQSVVNLPPQGEATLGFQWDTSGLLPASYVIRAEAVAVPDEDDVANNVLVDGVVALVIQELHDVAVTKLSPFKTLIFCPAGPWSEGYCFSVNVTVANQGNLPENVNVTLYVNNIVTNHTELSLSVNAVVTFTFAWNARDAVAYEDYLLNATAQAVDGEIDTSDNSLVFVGVRVAYPGDFDEDGDVDIFDVVTLASAYGGQTGDARYNPNVDVNCDGTIDIFDVVMVTSFYGYRRS